MKKALFLIFTLLILTVSCDEEFPLNTYQVEILNESTELLIIEAYLDGALQNVYTVNNNEVGLYCEYTEESFLGYLFLSCEIDRVVFKFDNGKGYISDVNMASGYDFPNESGIFGPSSKFIQNESGVYQFVITQQDFDNAFDLP